MTRQGGMKNMESNEKHSLSASVTIGYTIIDRAALETGSAAKHLFRHHSASYAPLRPLRLYPPSREILHAQ